MDAGDLGRLEPVEPREVWRHEAADFTPWLADEAGRRLLAAALGLEELELVEQEAAVGDFRADLLFRAPGEERLVLVENQLEDTDHAHLGQLLTYAAALEARIVVWVARRFREEHRAALDWLNRITGDDLHFFGLEVELWRIGDSPPAPRLNLAVRPNDWVKEVVEAHRTAGRLTDGGQAQVAFWTAFGEAAQARPRRWTRPRPRPDTWVGYGLGRTGFELCPTVSITNHWVAVRLHFSGDAAGTRLTRLASEREAIESQLGFPLTWKEKPGRKGCEIEVRREGDPTDPAQRDELIRWMLDRMDAFDRVLRPRIRAL